MRVLLATRIFEPEPAAAAFRLSALATALRSEGVAVKVLTTTVPGGAESPIDSLVEVRRAPVLRDSAGYVRGYLQYLSFDIPLFVRLLFSRRPDVVVVEPPPTTAAVVRLVCAIRRVPYVYFAADIWSDAAEHSAPKSVVGLLRTVESWAMKGASAILSVTSGVEARVRSLGVDGRIETVGNGVDTTVFSPHGPSPSMTGQYLLYAGTASEIQGAEVFIEAFELVLERHPEARLVFIGHGVDWARLQTMALALPDGAVVFEGRQPASEAAKWIRGATASLASIRPGIGYDFALPTKLLASVACGTPVIFVGTGPGHDFVTGAGVGAATTYSVDAVAEAMSAALDSPPDEARRASITEWGIANVSIAAAAERAASVIRSVGLHATRES